MGYTGWGMHIIAGASTIKGYTRPMEGALLQSAFYAMFRVTHLSP